MCKVFSFSDTTRVHDLLISIFWKEGNGLFNDALNTFYLRLYDVGPSTGCQTDTPIDKTMMYVCMYEI